MDVGDERQVKGHRGIEWSLKGDFGHKIEIRFTGEEAGGNKREMREIN